MTERFNFFDIYGYLIPGLTFVSLAWLPTGFATGTWPNLEWSSAFAVLIAAYLTGILLNRISTAFFATTVFDETAIKPRRKSDPVDAPEIEGYPRFPSDILLDDNQDHVFDLLRTRLDARVLAELRTAINRIFKVDATNVSARTDAFFLCRTFVRTQGAASYAEQFEGLYTLCRTLFGVLLLLAVYFSGWGFSTLIPMAAAAGLLVAAGILLLIFYDHPKSFLVVALLIAACGFVVPKYSVTLTVKHSQVMFAMSATSAVLSMPFYASFRHFTSIFAVTVYRDFHVLTCTDKSHKKRSDETNEGH